MVISGRHTASSPSWRWVRSAADSKRAPKHICRIARPSNGACEVVEDTVLSTSVRDDEILWVPNLRDHLKPIDSPFGFNNNMGGGFVGERDLVSMHTLKFESTASAGFRDKDAGDYRTLPQWAIRAGPRSKIYYDPPTVSAAIVTCGGLCPGLNDVVQNIVYTLADYGVPSENILGIRYGLRGFYSKDNKPIILSREEVDGIHLKGGTLLGTSRGGADIKEIVHRIDLWGLDMVFVIGGNGGNAAANAIDQECRRAGVTCSVVGVPKSIDNDILLIDRCFGFETACDEAQRALLAAKTEARSAYRGLGLVNVMGRQSGFIAMNASMASGVVDICLIPEIRFNMEKLLAHVERIIEDQGHCVVCVAEGAGQDLMAEQSVERDASGNPILADIGKFLAKYFKQEFAARGEPVDLKYIDPTYMIRAIPTIPSDRIYCKILGQNAVHAAFAGYTGLTTGLINTHYVLLPIPTVIAQPRVVNILGRKWNRLKTAINQPELT